MKIQHKETRQIFNIKKWFDINKYEYDSYYIQFCWPNKNRELEFKNKDKRDNFFEQVQNILNPTVIDSTQKPIKL